MFVSLILDQGQVAKRFKAPREDTGTEVTKDLSTEVNKRRVAQVSVQTRQIMLMGFVGGSCLSTVIERKVGLWLSQFMTFRLPRLRGARLRQESFFAVVRHLPGDRSSVRILQEISINLPV